jgi:hypothetical protein
MPGNAASSEIAVSCREGAEYTAQNTCAVYFSPCAPGGDLRLRGSHRAQCFLPTGDWGRLAAVCAPGGDCCGATIRIWMMNICATSQGVFRAALMGSVSNGVFRSSRRRRTTASTNWRSPTSPPIRNFADCFLSSRATLQLRSGKSIATPRAGSLTSVIAKTGPMSGISSFT